MLLGVSTPSHASPCALEGNLFQHPDRIAVLELHRRPAQDWHQNLHTLRRLKILYEGGWDWSGAPVMFGSLTSLALIIAIPALHVPNLRHLELSDLANRGDLFTLLQGCPLLEHISVSDLREPEVDPSLSVLLPNLQTYMQVSSTTGSLSIFNALSLPPSCSILLHIKRDAWPGLPNYMPSSFENPDYLAGIKGVKLTISIVPGSDVTDGTLELFNAKGTRLRFRGTYPSDHEGSWPRNLSVQDAAHLDFLKGLRGQTLEVSCLDEQLSEMDNCVSIRFLLMALDLGCIGMVILSGQAVLPCLVTLLQHMGTGNHSPWSVHTIIIHVDLKLHQGNDGIEQLLDIARDRKAAGNPLNSVSLHLCGLSGEGLQDFKGLKGLVKKLAVVTEDDVSDWDADVHFQGGLGYPQES